MSHYKLVKQDSVSGYNLDGIEQEAGESFVILNDDLFVDSFNTLHEALLVMADLTWDDSAERMSMDITL